MKELKPVMKALQNLRLKGIEAKLEIKASDEKPVQEIEEVEESQSSEAKESLGKMAPLTELGKKAKSMMKG